MELSTAALDMWCKEALTTMNHQKVLHGTALPHTLLFSAPFHSWLKDLKLGPHSCIVGVHDERTYDRPRQGTLETCTAGPPDVCFLRTTLATATHSNRAFRLNFFYLTSMSFECLSDFFWDILASALEKS